MISGVVLLNTASGTQNRVLEILRLIDGVEEAHALYGEALHLIRMSLLQRINFESGQKNNISKNN